jgi:3-mercaptopyruvate sulfurtransferase SseA
MIAGYPMIRFLIKSRFKDDTKYKNRRIAGAVWGHNSGDLMDAIDGTLRSYPEVAQMWQDSGITPDKRLSFY